MVEERRIPPPIRGTDRGQPSISEGRSPRTADLLMQLGGRGAPGGGTQQAVQLVMQAAQMLVQAGELDPIVAPVIQQTLQTLQSGLQGLGGGGMGGPPPTGMGRPPRRPRRAMRGEFEGGGEEGQEGGGV